MNITHSNNPSVDQLVIMRARMLLFAALSMALWQFGWIAQDLLSDTSTPFFQIAAWSTIAGAICQIVTTVLFIKFNRQMKNAKAWSALHDELVIKNRNITFYQSYFIMFGMIFLSIPLLNYLVIDAQIAIRIVATIGLCLPMIIFARHELSSACP